MDLKFVSDIFLQQNMPQTLQLDHCACNAT